MTEIKLEIDLSSMLTRTKIVAMGFGMMAMSMGATSVNNCNHGFDFELFNPLCKDSGQDKFFIGAVIAIFVLSLASISVSEIFGKTKWFNLVDLCFHVIGGIIIFIAGCVFINSSVSQRKEMKELSKYYKVIFKYFGARIAASVFAMLAGILHGVIAFLVLMTKLRA